MSRLMSVALTEQAVRDQRKTVTRRLGWLFLKPGDRLTLVRKVQGRKPGEPIVRLAEVEVVSVGRGSILSLTEEDVARECVPLRDQHGHERFDEIWWPDGGSFRDAQPTVESWITWYCGMFDIHPYLDDVTRIEWRYLSGAPSK
jgi:hypothetical protein